VFLQELILGFCDRQCLEKADCECAHYSGFELWKAPVGCVDEVEVGYGCFGIPLVDAVLDDVSGAEVFLGSHDTEGGSGEYFETAFFSGLKNTYQFETLGFEHPGCS